MFPLLVGIKKENWTFMPINESMSGDRAVGLVEESCLAGKHDFEATITFGLPDRQEEVCSVVPESATSPQPQVRNILSGCPKLPGKEHVLANWRCR